MLIRKLQLLRDFIFVPRPPTSAVLLDPAGRLPAMSPQLWGQIDAWVQNTRHARVTVTAC